MANADSSKVTSDDLRKQILEQTSMIEAEESDTVTVSADVVEEEVSEEESTKEETAPEEEAETTKEESKEKPQLYKIVVEGKEEYIPLEKVIQYAQQGRYLERERAKDKSKQAETQKLEPGHQDFDPTKLNEKFVEELQKDALGTIVKLMNTGWEIKKSEEKKQREADKTFESDKKELPHFKEVKPIYDEFRENGDDRETAWAKAESDYFKDLVVKVSQKGVTEAAKKLKLQEKAKIPTGEKKTESREITIPTPEEIKKMSPKDLKKLVRHVQNEGW